MLLLCFCFKGRFGVKRELQKNCISFSSRILWELGGSCEALLVFVEVRKQYFVLYNLSCEKKKGISFLRTESFFGLFFFTFIFFLVPIKS